MTMRRNPLTGEHTTALRERLADLPARHREWQPALKRVQVLVRCAEIYHRAKGHLQLVNGRSQRYVPAVPFRRAAQRAFIIAESFLRPAGVIPVLPRFGELDVSGCPPRTFVHLAFAAADILALASADIVRLRPPPDAGGGNSAESLNNPKRRFSSPSIC